MRLRLDPFVAALMATAAIASLLPVSGDALDTLWWISKVTVALLFFGYGVRLPTRDVASALAHWRLHAVILATTFVLFPLLGLAVAWRVDDDLRAGVLLLAVVPSTMQSSVAFTAIARGNVAGSVVSASLSNLVGVFVTPLLVGLLIGTEADVTGAALGQIALILLLPFVLGQLARPLLGALAERHDRGIRVYDRFTILVIVYLAFSEGRTSDVWGDLGVASLIVLVVVCIILLTVLLGWTSLVARWFVAADRAPIVFCGSHKSLAAGLPMASVLFGTEQVALVVLPLMLYHQLQLIVCAWLAAKWGRREPSGKSS